MDSSLNNYLRSLIPNWNYNNNPLDKVEVNYPEEQSFNCLANKILSYVSNVPIERQKHKNELICQIFKLNTLIKAYNFIKNTARYKGTSDITITDLAHKEFTKCEGSLRRLGLEVEQFEEVVDKFQELSMHDTPKENVYEMQICKMVALVKAYLENNKLDIDSRDKEGRTQFYIACRSGELEKAKVLMSLGCNPNIPDFEGYTPFFTACHNGMTEIVAILIDSKKVDPNILTQGCSPLFIACQNGFDEIVSIIAKSNRADLNAKYKETTPFRKAISNGNKNCAQILIAAGIDINAQDELGRTLFHSFIEQKDIEKAKMLLSLGCDPNIPDFTGYTPFFTACYNKMTEIVDLLIKSRNVNPNILCQGCSPLFIACERGFDEIASIIVNSQMADLNAAYKGKTPFGQTINNGHKNCAQILIAAGVDINKQDEIGNTPFHSSIKYKNSEKAKMLLSLGCDPNIPNLEGFTPFYTACNLGMTEIVAILIDSGKVDPNILTQGCSPLYTACDNGFDEIVSIIVNSGRVNLNVGYDGTTPFNRAISKEHKNCAKILIAAGADINKQDELGNTPFHSSIKDKNSEKAKMLLSLGCNPNIPDLEGFTPFYNACNIGMTEIVAILIDSGEVDPNILTQDCPPLFTACDHGFDEIVSIIAKSRRVDLNAKYKGRTSLIMAIVQGHKKCAKILIEEGADFTVQTDDGKNPLLLACEYGLEEVVSIIAQKNNVNINIKQLDLHNIAIVFEREKIKLKGNYFSRHNYNFTKLNSFLRRLNEKKEHAFRKKVLDSLCSSIVDSLKNGTFQEFKNFLNFGKSFYESTIQYIIHFLKQDPYAPIVNIMERYEQILPIEIENVGSLKKLDKLKLAYLLEIEIPKIGYAAHKIFSQKNGEYPRTLIVEKGGRRFFILAKKQFSIIRGKGGFKDVKSALLVPQYRSLKVERVVYAQIIKKTKAEALDAQKEYSLIKDFSGFTGFGKAYKFFCFDKNGNYVSKQNIGIIGQEEEVRSALVIEEMNGDFHKAITQLTLNEQVSVTKQLVEAMNTMMRKEKVSWDLKLPNILISRNIPLQEIKVAITDLGLVRDIQQGAVKKARVYGSPWYGAPELLYATDVVADANAHLKCEMWALGLVLYNMCFKNEFPLVDWKFFNEYKKYKHLPVVNQIAHYKLSYAEYVRRLNDLVEKPLKALLLLPKETKTPRQNLEILTYRMLQLDRNIRITPADADEFCRENFNGSVYSIN